MRKYKCLCDIHFRLGLNWLTFRKNKEKKSLISNLGLEIWTSISEMDLSGKTGTHLTTFWKKNKREVA